MEQIRLGENHRRSLTASLLTIERMILETETFLNHPPCGALCQVVNDFASQSDAEETLKLTGEIKAQIALLQNKYGLKPEPGGLRWFINVRKTKIWEILGNTRSAKMKRYGTLPPEFAHEFDDDIGKLKALTEKL